MSPVALAVVAAFCFAASHVANKRGTGSTSVVGGLLVSLSAGWLLLLIVTLVDRPPQLPAGPIVVFGVSGLIAPAIGRAAAIAGIHRLGPSVSVPVQTSVYPLFAVAGAILLLGEPVTWPRVVGTMSIVVGIALLARQTTAADDAMEADADLKPGSGRLAYRGRVALAIAFPILAGLAYGASDLVRKEAVTSFPHPEFGAFVALSAALAVWGLAVVLAPSIRRRVAIGNGAGWFVAGGVLASTAIVVQFHALEVADVSLVSPIVAAQPLIVFVLSAVLLRGVERLTVPVVLGGLTAIVGVILVSR
jgi:drug/metabolite transporter (DMT)-like permease